MLNGSVIIVTEAKGNESIDAFCERRNIFNVDLQFSLVSGTVLSLFFSNIFGMLSIFEE